MQNLTALYKEIALRLERFGQGHLLDFWPTLIESERAELLGDLAEIDFELCASLVGTYVRERPTLAIAGQIDAAEVLPAVPDSKRKNLYADARNAGAEAIRRGQVAAFTVAGGQGTRLGYDGPKGAFAISPIRNAPLFQLFAEYLHGVERRYGRRPPWYIMTSLTNHEETVAFFEANGFFGLAAHDVTFFRQGQMPAFLPDGKIALREPHRVALSPDGHGGSLRALAASGALHKMRTAGIEQISYFQVDNPLVHPIDPLFIGLHRVLESEMSSKAVTKASDTERVGNFCRVDGTLQVIEYSDLPEQLARARNSTGERMFNAGSIAIHVIDRSFVERLTAEGAAHRLPWHRADKRMPIVTPGAVTPDPIPGDVVKLEMFVFDAIPLAKNLLVLYTPREEEFSPVKNADGADSPAVARRDLVRRAARWLEAAGVQIPRTAAGEPDALIEISPSFGLDADDLRERLHTRPVIRSGGTLLLE